MGQDRKLRLQSPLTRTAKAVTPIPQSYHPCIYDLPYPMGEEANTNHRCHFYAKPPIVAFTEAHWARFSKVMEIDL